MANKNIDIVKAAAMTPGPNGRWGLPILIEGEPGIGKTSIIESEVSKASGLHQETVIASLREPADFLGFPIITDGTMSYAPAQWVSRVCKKARAIVFMDELNTAPPSVQAALLRVVLDGAVGDVQLPPGVRFIAAQNATEDAAGGWDLSAPLANRFGHLKWDAPDLESWSAWLLGESTSTKSKIKAADLEAEVMRQWPDAWAKARGLVSGFLRKRPDLLQQMPGADSPDRSKAWPSARSWENATRALASSYVHGMDEDTAHAFMSAFIGTETAYEFNVWMSEADLPDPIEVLDGKVTFKHNPYRLDITAAVLNACVGYVTPEDAVNRAERTEKLWEIIAELSTDAADLVISPIKALSKAKLAKTKQARKVLAKFSHIFGAVS